MTLLEHIEKTQIRLAPDTHIALEAILAGGSLGTHDIPTLTRISTWLQIELEHPAGNNHHDSWMDEARTVVRKIDDHFKGRRSSSGSILR